MKINLLCIGAGLAAGYFLAIARLKNVYGQMLETEIAAEVDRLEDAYVKKIEEETEVIVKAHDEEIEEIKILAADGAAAIVNYQGFVQDGKIEDVPFEPEESLAARAQCIEYEEYMDIPDDWGKAYAEYYKADQVLAGTNGEKVAEKWLDILNAVVYETIEATPSVETFYVKIEEHKIAVEIFCVDESWAMVHLGESVG